MGPRLLQIYSNATSPAVTPSRLTRFAVGSNIEIDVYYICNCHFSS